MNKFDSLNNLAKRVKPSRTGAALGEQVCMMECAPPCLEELKVGDLISITNQQ